MGFDWTAGTRLQFGIQLGPRNSTDAGVIMLDMLDPLVNHGKSTIHGHFQWLC
jgi:hypothetical protein